MEKYDVVIIGGGSAGLAALKQLSNLGKQAVLIEQGKQAGNKNVSGGILYSKKPSSGQVYNVEDVYGNDFLKELPVERKITQYMLHATSKDKVYSLDLTKAHEYQSNFGYSVLMNKLNSWFAKEANESAERFGGGMVPGVKVDSIRWEGNDKRTVIQTSELEEFETKAVIAADGVNSETAVLTGARDKFSTSELYQGVKVVVNLPEEIIEERFGVNHGEGAAHLFAGDVTMNNIGGGFLYTNKDTLSLGAVYHFDSLYENPHEPYTLVNSLIQNPLVREYIKDTVPKRKEIDRNLSKEEQLRLQFGMSKLIKKWKELRQSYLSPGARKNLIDSGKYKNEDDIKKELHSVYSQLFEKYGAEFLTDYVELEYSAKLVPDGKRCRMQNPFFKNVLFVGDAAGRGIFVGPRIEGINVGIDDACRAAESISNSIDRNISLTNHLGPSFAQLVNDSPYTKDMRQIDKDYLKIFLNAAKDVPKEVIGSKYGTLFNIIRSGGLLGVAVHFANILGYERLLPMVENVDTYVNVPIELAQRYGKKIESVYEPSIPSVEDRVAQLNYDDDSVSHITLKDTKSKFMQKMVTMCPTKCYSIENGSVTLQHEGCIECGTCAKETEWKHPRGERGVNYQYG